MHTGLEIQGVSEKITVYQIINTFKMVTRSNVIFLDMINITSIYLCAKFQAHMWSVQLWRYKGCLDKWDLDDKTANLNTNVLYRPSPIWPIILLAFIILVMFGIWSWNFTHNELEVAAIKSPNITLLLCIILKILISCYTILVFLRPQYFTLIRYTFSAIRHLNSYIHLPSITSTSTAITFWSSPRGIMTSA